MLKTTKVVNIILVGTVFNLITSILQNLPFLFISPTAKIKKQKSYVT